MCRESRPMWAVFLCPDLSAIPIHMPQVASPDRHAGDVGFASQRKGLGRRCEAAMANCGERCGPAVARRAGLVGHAAALH